MKSRYVCILLAAILLLSAAMALGQIWEKKDYKEWPAKECDKILSDSPWAKNQSVYAQGMGSDAASGRAYTKFTVQFLSALPIRHATIRQQQLAAKYDSLPPEKKQEFDQQAQKYLATDYSQKVVVKVLYETNQSTSIMDMDRSWRIKTIANFQNTASLISSKGIKVMAEGYTPSQTSSQFLLIFPRVKDGKPLLTADDKSLLLQFEYSPIGGMGDGKGQFDFKVKNMIYNGEIAY
jgi:hypothetical protein